MKQHNKYITIVLILFIALNFNGYSQDSSPIKAQSIIENLGAGIEYMKNSEVSIMGQYRWNNIVIVGNARWCTHVEKVYFYPGIKYYFDKSIYGITPLLNIRYGRLHYDQKWLSVGYDYDVVYVWDASMGQMMPEVRPSYSTKSGSSLINTPALTLSGGGEYNIGNFGVNATIGMSYFTKIKGDFKNKNKFFFSIGALYYFGKK